MSTTQIKSTNDAKVIVIVKINVQYYKTIHISPSNYKFYTNINSYTVVKKIRLIRIEYQFLSWLYSDGVRLVYLLKTLLKELLDPNPQSYPIASTVVFSV